MKELYSNFGNEKCEIISVSIDKDRKRWLKAIADDKLNWPQLIDSTDADKPSGYGRGYQSYKGKAVPLSFLISPEQIITDINLSVTELELTLRKIYSSSKNK
jgi:alkyl hydroperoxide reductase subunit AhpC